MHTSTVIITLFLVGLGSSEVINLSSNTNTKNPTSIYCGLDKVNSSVAISWNYTNAAGVSEVIGTGALILNLTSIAQTGEYMCLANDNLVNTISVFHLAKPIIQNTRKSVTFNDGDNNRKLTCISQGSYPTVTFKWSRREEGVDNVIMLITPTSDPNINITTSGNNSTILFRNLTYDMQAYYMCEVKNTVGNETVEVLIRVKDKLAALWPFLGIVAEVVILITIIFMYEKHSKKTIVEEVDVKDEEEKPLKKEENDEEKDPDVRNRVPNNNYK